jgi:hypothetical protein
MAVIDNSTDPWIDRWLRSREPRVELAVRYCLLGRFLKAQRSLAFRKRIDELIDLLKPNDDELASITQYASEIGQVIDGQIDIGKIEAQIKTVEPTPRRRQDQDLERFEQRLKELRNRANDSKNRAH